jgi:8-oxo-dGTP pyrophosphatase MutT (NUDIX family)
MKPGTPAWSVVMVVPKGGSGILAVNRGFNPRDPALPGGDSEEADESPAATAARELFEETGIKALELRCMAQWVGERGQPVFAFFVPRWQGSHLRVSEEGKPFWAHPRSLVAKTAYFRDDARKLLEQLGRIPQLAEPQQKAS